MVEEQGRAPEAVRTALPNLDDLPVVQQGFDRNKVAEAFEAFRRHLVELEKELRGLQAARTSGQAEPTGHAVRMDALHLIRAAAEFADQLESDAQKASLAQLRRTQEEVKRRTRDVNVKTEELDRFRQEIEKQRSEILNAARAEAREVITKANEEAAREVQEAESRGARLLEQSRAQANEITNSARGELEQTLEWARNEATAIVSRAQEGAEDLLSVAGLGSKERAGVVQAIMRSARAAEGARPAAEDGQRGTARPESEASPTEPEPAAEVTRAAEPPADADQEAGKSALEEAIRPTRRLRPRVKR